MKLLFMASNEQDKGWVRDILGVALLGAPHVDPNGGFNNYPKKLGEVIDARKAQLEANNVAFIHKGTDYATMDTRILEKTFANDAMTQTQSYLRVNDYIPSIDFDRANGGWEDARIRVNNPDPQAGELPFIHIDCRILHTGNKLKNQQLFITLPGVSNVYTYLGAYDHDGVNTNEYFPSEATQNKDKRYQEKHLGIAISHLSRNILEKHMDVTATITDKWRVLEDRMVAPETAYASDSLPLFLRCLQADPKDLACINKQIGDIRFQAFLAEPGHQNRVKK